MRSLIPVLATLALVAFLAACGAPASPDGSGAEPESAAREDASHENAPPRPEEEAALESSSRENSSGESTSAEQAHEGGREAESQLEETRPAEDSGEEEPAARVPEDETLRLTIPGMERVEDVEIPDAAYDDEQSLRQNTAIHLRGTGFPWQAGANVYIAGHRLGYPGTGSFLAFYDLDELEHGDEITVSDSEGKEYVYEVFNELVASPTEDLHLTEPLEGKDLLTLQTCTLPDYSERIIVQAELKEG